MSEEKNTIVPDFDFEVDSPEEDFNIQDDDVQDQKDDSVEDDTPPAIQDGDGSSKEELELPEDADPNVVAAYKFYREKGIINNDYEDFDGSPEALQQIMQLEDEGKYNQIYDYMYEQSPEFARPLLELILTKGNELTPEEAQQIFEISKGDGVKPEDLDDESKAEAFLKKYYMQTHEDTEEEAIERIDLLKDRNKLTKEAKTILGKDQEVKQKLIQTKVEQAKEEKKQKEAIAAQFENDFVDSIKEAKWRDDLKQEVAQEFYGGMFKKKMDHIMQNPKALSQLVHFMKYYDGKSFDMSAFQKVAETSTNNKRKNNIQHYWSGNVSGGGRQVSEDNSGGIDLTNFEIEL